MTLLEYLAWWAKWRLRGLAAGDDAARLRLTWESQAELEALITKAPPVERDVNGQSIDGP